jgi:SAM-dependent methyltransferase
MPSPNRARIRPSNDDRRSGREHDLARRTIDDFGEQWSHFHDNSGFFGSAALLADHFGPLLTPADLAGRRVADIGAGAGRFVNVFLDSGAAHVVAVEPSDAFFVLKRNTERREARITYLHATGDALPPALGLDAAFSIGVLHHIPDPLPVLVAARTSLRPGGQFFGWLYGREGNGTYLLPLAVLRGMSAALPHRALLAVSWLLYWPLRAYIAAAHHVGLPLAGYATHVLAPLDPEKVRLVIYDQLKPAYAKYYRREEVHDLFARAGYADITLYHRHGYSWAVRARRPETDSE